MESIGKLVPISLNFEGQSVLPKIGSSQTELMRPLSENQEPGSEADGQTPTELKDHIISSQRELGMTSRRTMSRTPQRVREQVPTRKQSIKATEEKICSANSVTLVDVYSEKNFKEN